MNHTKFFVWLGLVALTACDAQVSEEPYAESIAEPAFVLAEPLYEGNTVRTPDSECSSADGDGIGGTGCPID